MHEKGWTRREFLALAGSTAFAAALPWRPAGACPPARLSALPPPSADAVALYGEAFVLDANTLASLGYLPYQPDFQASLDAIRGSGLTALKTTLGGPDGTFEQVVAELGTMQALFERCPDFMRVTGPGDLSRAKREGRIAVILSFEAASMLEGKLERIELFRQFDVRVMQLTYNHRTPFGTGCLDGDAEGLTALGRRAIDTMNARGVALDLSHANARTTEEGIAASRKPAVITHAGCRAVFDHPRNKSDEAMRALAAKGGVMGIYMLPFLTPDSRQPTLADYMRHLVHALDVCGEDHVGIGTDSLFFTATDDDLRAIAADEVARRKAGLGAPGENRPPYLPDVNTPRKLAYVADALLRHGYTARMAEKVLGLNFRRVFDGIWTG